MSNHLLEELERLKSKLSRHACELRQQMYSDSGERRLGTADACDVVFAELADITKRHGETKPEPAQTVSLRDHFAGMAMQGWIARSSATHISDHPAMILGVPDSIAKNSYQIADAMVREQANADQAAIDAAVKAAVVAEREACAALCSPPICGSQGFAGPSCCILPPKHEGHHKYGEPRELTAKEIARLIRDKV
jgi:hypothetical protein